METVDDILDELRKGVKDWKGAPVFVFDDICDRFEAAHKRKVDAMETEIGRLIAERNYFEERNRVSNDEIARLLGALKQLLAMMGDFSKCYALKSCDECWTYKNYLAGCPYRIAMDALRGIENV